MVESAGAFASRAGGRAAWQYPKVAGSFLQAFTFKSAADTTRFWRRSPLCNCFYAEGRRLLPDRVPVGHLGPTEKKLIFEEGNRIGGFTRLQRSRICATDCIGDVWVEEVDRFDRSMKI